ncbi:nucleotide exchange factor GrpE [Stackebrandtia soli]|uniref:nucleotide exchange factor GrpE n=1 Tax=Stackebrandtia soli TaxID=1892856 RepID=UPI0039EBBE57
MSTSHLRLIATVAVIAASALTGAVTGLITATETVSFNSTAAATSFIGAAISGFTVLILLGGRLHPVTTPAAVAAPDTEALAAIDQLNTERRTLINTCIYVRDRATSQAIADKIGAGLQSVGVATVTPVGERFDPTRHEAGGTTPAPDPAHDGLIAVVETAGYTDRAAVLRSPIVTVYRGEGRRA